jgi:hypothetical protein
VCLVDLLHWSSLNSRLVSVHDCRKFYIGCSPPTNIPDSRCSTTVTTESYVIWDVTLCRSSETSVRLYTKLYTVTSEEIIFFLEELTGTNVLLRNDLQQSIITISFIHEMQDEKAVNLSHSNNCIMRICMWYHVHVCFHNFE